MAFFEFVLISSPIIKSLVADHQRSPGRADASKSLKSIPDFRLMVSKLCKVGNPSIKGLILLRIA